MEIVKKDIVHESTKKFTEKTLNKKQVDVWGVPVVTRKKLGKVKLIVLD